MCEFKVKAVILETGRITLIFLWLFETRSNHLIYDDGRGRDRVKWNLEVLVPAGLRRPALYYSEEQSVRWNDKAVSALGFNQTLWKVTKWNICPLLRNFSTLSLQDLVPLVLENVNLYQWHAGFCFWDLNLTLSIGSLESLMQDSAWARNGEEEVFLLWEAFFFLLLTNGKPCYFPLQWISMLLQSVAC